MGPYNTMNQLYEALSNGEYSGFEEEIVGALAPAGFPGGFPAPVAYNPYAQQMQRAGVSPYAQQMQRAQAFQPMPYNGPQMMPAQMRSSYPAAGLAPMPLPRLNRVPLGIDSGTTAIPIGSTADIELKPQVKFRPERLIVSDAIAGDFLINDIKIGKYSLFPSSDPIPATMFIASATDVQLAFRTAQVGQVIVVTVTNIDTAAAHRFTGGFVGATAEN